MKKGIIFILLILTALSFSQILNYVPENFKVIRYVKDLSEFYSEIKSLPTGRFLTESLGLEMMIQGVLESQLLSRDIEPSDFYDLLSHEFLFVQLNSEDTCFVLGPSEKAKKLKDSIKSLVVDLLGMEDVVVVEKDGYLFLGTAKAVNASLKGGGKIPDTLKTADFFGYGLLQGEKYSFTVVSTKESASDHLSIKVEIAPADDTSRNFLEKVGQPRKVPSDYYTFGELTVIFNTENYDGLLDVLSSAGFSIESENLPVQLPESDIEKVVKNLFEELEPPMFLSANVSSAVMDLIAGSTPTNLEVVAKARLKTPDAVENALKAAGVQYRKEGRCFVLENGLSICTEGDTVVLKSEQFSPRDLDITPAKNDVFFLFLDMKAVMESLVGEGEEAYIFARGFYKDGKMVFYVNVK
ncbi:hypothetical protein THMA_0278 [Thermotoga maritima MSB8]|uniref:Uncharacterized protein n=1 Tax=Thermotoga maritima (strain ATCC 43589 / DSM 3109 / JCM 10099 / NBRC 100826 / MSB8) TaxID=243274 RepID=Q9WYA8_THEMA|nr:MULTISPECIES: hypothetical protein [Thermotoga]AAD35360.1 hypothetical protein TM_0271 [Thermotoga maritima MSB8]AGL49195.1 hypothetical protein Tmari_0269 [Thermotoga maritima MSB8]AHD17965.1 hypothetical protein THEMA_03370 [Thermotoga maritima MSB8]AIY86234.1 hypothetical protein T2812B_03445 [Thermotoga sp. 2812B]AKE26210.1 hypothetical protein THMC_0278 [Thermotoga maritima]